MSAPADVASSILRRLSSHGFDFATGVPCSLLSGIFRRLESPAGADIFGIEYLPAPREDTAVGIAAGVALGGRKPVVLMQNSGLGYSLNSFTSLTMIYGINPLVIMSWRGYGGTDAVEHDVIGRVLVPLLEAARFGHVPLDPSDPGKSVDAAVSLHEEGSRPVALLIAQEV